jgi:hypothetical protein
MQVESQARQACERRLYVGPRGAPRQLGYLSEEGSAVHGLGYLSEEGMLIMQVESPARQACALREYLVDESHPGRTSSSSKRSTNEVSHTHVLRASPKREMLFRITKTHQNLENDTKVQQPVRENGRNNKNYLGENWRVGVDDVTDKDLERESLSQCYLAIAASANCEHGAERLGETFPSLGGAVATGVESELQRLNSLDFRKKRPALSQKNPACPQELEDRVDTLAATVKFALSGPLEACFEVLYRTKPRSMLPASRFCNTKYKTNNAIQNHHPPLPTRVKHLS